MASLRRVKSSSALPNSDQAPQLALSRELPSTADLKFVRILISTITQYHYILLYRLRIGQKLLMQPLKIWKLNMGSH